MVNEFNKLVGDMLAAEGAVHLPDVGTLVIVRRAAEKISSRRLRRACNAVIFTDKVRGRSVVDAVAEICGTERSEAEDIYRRWLSKVTADGVVAIDGVGHIDRMKFYVDDAFDKLLNPNGHQVVELKKHRGRTIVRVCVWTLLLLVAAVPAGICIYECREDIADTVGAWFAPKERPARTEEPAEANGPEQSAEIAVADKVPESESRTESLSESRPESKPEPQTESRPESKPETQTESRPESNPEPQTEPRPESKPESQPRQDVAPSAQSAQSAQAAPSVVPSDGIGRLTSGWSYVVYGVFSTPENALRAVAELRANGVNGSSAFAYGPKYMVALYVSADAADCNRFIRSAFGFESLWVYTAH